MFVFRKVEVARDDVEVGRVLLELFTPQRAVVRWCCGDSVVVEVCRREEETLERWTSASAETSHGVIMMSRRHGARSDCLLVSAVLQCAHTNQFSVHGCL